MCRGEDPAAVETIIQPPKSLGHGKVMPPDTKDRDIVHMYLIHMGEKVAQRLRKHFLVARTFFIGLRSGDGWVGSNKLRTKFPTNSSRAIYELSKKVLYQYWQGEGVYQVQITALDPRPEKGQIDLFDEENVKTSRLNEAMDRINRRFGEFTIAPAVLLGRSDMPNVIAPAWKPYGHRQTIVSTVEQKKTERTKQTSVDCLTE
jgi:DNA polymerase-4